MNFHINNLRKCRYYWCKFHHPGFITKSTNQSPEIDKPTNQLKETDDSANQKKAQQFETHLSLRAALDLFSPLSSCVEEVDSLLSFVDSLFIRWYRGDRFQAWLFQDTPWSVLLPIWHLTIFKCPEAETFNFVYFVMLRYSATYLDFLTVVSANHRVMPPLQMMQ